MPDATIDHAAGRRIHPEDGGPAPTVNPDIGDPMGLNKLRYMKGERDPRPADPPPAGPAVPREAPGVEGVQPPSLPGQAELFPTPKGSAKDQALLF